MRTVDAQGIGKSKEFGFVSFTKHEHALQALRNINNNPNIFTSAKVRIPVIWHCLWSPYSKFYGITVNVSCFQNKWENSL
jgi:RNA recognition motif-containing protein